MRMQTVSRVVFDCPVDDVLAALPAPEDPIWDAHSLRQKSYSVHAATRSIMLKWCLWPRGDETPVVLSWDGAPPALFAAADACAQRIAGACGGTVVTLLLTELAPGAAIPRHCDKGALLERTHRCHLPVVTDPLVRFTLDGETCHLRAGRVYEVDNMRPHSVANPSAIPRVHLICNVLPSEPGAGLQSGL